MWANVRVARAAAGALAADRPSFSGCYVEASWILTGETKSYTISSTNNEVGGFGALLGFGFDYSENPQAWHNSLRLLSDEVLPRVRHLVPKPTAAAAE